MNSPEKKIFALAFAAILIISAFSSLSATEVRVGTMGGVGFYVHDNSNIFFFPGAIYSYSGQVYGEFRVKKADNSYTVGVNYPVGDYSVVGIYLNRPIPLAIRPGIVNRVTLDQTTDIFYGTQMSQFDLGLRLSIGLDNFKRDVPTTPSTEVKEDARYLALGAGLTNETMDLGLLVELPSAKYDSSSSPALTNKWGGVGIGFAGRLFRGETTKLVPLVAFNYRKTSSKFEPGNAKTDFTDMNLGVGVGLNHQLNENNLLVMAVEILGLQSSKAEPSPAATNITDTRMVFPGLFMGVESKIKPWLTGRLGAAEVWESDKHKVEPSGGVATETTTRQSQYNVSFGLGFNFGDFTVDASINEGLFFDGPNFISGTTEVLANRLAVVYKF